MMTTPHVEDDGHCDHDYDGLVGHGHYDCFSSFLGRLFGSWVCYSIGI